MLSDLFLKCLRAEYTHKESVSYALLREGAALTVLFEDSNGAVDWYRNLDFAVKAYEGALVHRGFLSAFLTVERELGEAISSSALRRLTVAGYSHGGALATLFHAYAYRARPDLRAHSVCVTYGAPRVYRRAPKDSADVFARLLRVENRGDLVTDLPPKAFGFSHVGKELSVGAKGKYGPLSAHTAESYLQEILAFERSLYGTND